MRPYSYIYLPNAWSLSINPSSNSIGQTQTQHRILITMRPLLQSHASDCEQDKSSEILPTIVESIFEVEATKSVETDKVEGIFLTWEDLWVTVSNGNNGRKPILEGLKGYAKPGQLLAIMGPSGCGKSTLLDALAGNYGIIGPITFVV
jgi:ABC-type transport system involved in cytochrome bd biosynthesis fused ATPase/permease subunit